MAATTIKQQQPSTTKYVKQHIPPYLAVGTILNDRVALTKGFEVAQKAVGRAGINTDSRSVFGGDIRRAFLQH